MTTFVIEYQCHGYSLADAFRLDPKWGRRTFIVDGEEVGVNDLEEIRSLAKRTAPHGYELHRVTVVGAGRNTALAAGNECPGCRETLDGELVCCQPEAAAFHQLGGDAE